MLYLSLWLLFPGLSKHTYYIQPAVCKQECLAISDRNGYIVQDFVSFGNDLYIKVYYWDIKNCPD